MNSGTFAIEKRNRAPFNKLEQHLLKIATIWCNQGTPLPVYDLADFRKHLEKEAAWYCRDTGCNPATILIGFYDEDTVFIRPNNNSFATATIRLAGALQPQALI